MLICYLWSDQLFALHGHKLTRIQLVRKQLNGVNGENVGDQVVNFVKFERGSARKAC